MRSFEAGEIVPVVARLKGETREEAAKRLLGFLLTLQQQLSKQGITNIYDPRVDTRVRQICKSLFDLEILVHVPKEKTESLTAFMDRKGIPLFSKGL